MKGTGLKRSFTYAMAGITCAFRQERNMGIHGVAAIIVLALAFFLKVSRWEWGLLITAIFMVLIAETVNTAIETVVDLHIKDYHPLAKVAKDLAAGAVLLSAIMAIIMAFIVFGPYFSALIGGV